MCVEQPKPLGLGDAILRGAEERFDVGTVPGYCAAFVNHALNDPVLGPALRAKARALLDDER